MVQSFATLMTSIGIDSTHFMAEMIGSLLAPVLIALPRAKKRLNAW
jgi:hypothetical protein